MRATLLGTATGILFGLSAALTKAVVDQFDEGLIEIFENWHIYALAVVGYASMTLSQLSLQTGVLPPAMATSMIFDPLASVVLGSDPASGVTCTRRPAGAIVSLLALGGDGSRARRAGAQPGSPLTMTKRAYAARLTLRQPRLAARLRVAEEDHQPHREPDRQADPCVDRSVIISASAVRIPIVAMTCRYGTRNGRSRSGRWRRRTMHAGADEQEGEQGADRDELRERVEGDEAGDHRADDAADHGREDGSREPADTRAKAGGSIPSSDIRMKMRVWP